MGDRVAGEHTGKARAERIRCNAGASAGHERCEDLCEKQSPMSRFVTEESLQRADDSLIPRWRMLQRSKTFTFFLCD